jgi:large subunit ribosomal protein L25
MADQVALTAEPRDGSGRSEARRLRREGRVPAVAYGSGLDATPVSVDGLELYHALRTDAGLNALIRLDVEGDVHLTLARELQRHPVRREILHVDFVAVDRRRKVTVDVPIHLLGHAQGADEGGVVDQVRFTTAVEVLPLEVPDELTLDIAEMQIGDVKRLGDLTLPKGVTLLDDADSTVVSVSAPIMEVLPEDEAAAEAEAAEAEGGEVSDAGTAAEEAAAEEAAAADA